MKIYAWSLLLVTALAFASCTNDDAVSKAVKSGKLQEKYNGTGTGLSVTPPVIDNTGNTGVPNGGRGIYYAGVAQNESGVAVASYWKDGVLNNLATYQSYAAAIAVTENDVYVAGQIDGHATVWKNGVPITLCTEWSTANSIVVSGSDVYVSGDIAPGNGYAYAIIWKNGVATKLTEDNVYSEPGQLLVIGADVYLSGKIYKEGKNYAVYWKNGEATLLTSGSAALTYGGSIAISGSDIYVTLYESDRIAKYWHNGEVVILANDAITSSTANVIAVSNGNIYVAGITGGFAQGEGRMTYWKNGISFVNNDDPVKPNTACSITVSGDDVYIAGSTVESPIGITWSSAKFWLNGVATVLPGGYDGTNVDYASAMTIYTGESGN